MKKLLVIIVLLLGCAAPEPLELRARRRSKYIRPGTAEWYELSTRQKQEELVKQHKATGLPPKHKGLHVVIRGAD